MLFTGWQVLSCLGASVATARRLCTIAVQPPKLLPRKRRTELLKCFQEMDRCLVKIVCEAALFFLLAVASCHIRSLSFFSRLARPLLGMRTAPKEITLAWSLDGIQDAAECWAGFASIY